MPQPIGKENITEMDLTTSSSTNEDIDISYFNMTGDVNFQVMAYARNGIEATNYHIAWHVLRAQGRVDFKYPAKVKIGASHHYGNMDSQAGPFEADLGSTWEIIHEKPEHTPCLKKGECRRNKLCYIFTTNLSCI